MAESFCRVGDVDLCFETFGDPADPAVLLIMGLGTQMIAWHEDFCAQLAGRGFHVIRYDNRDVGRSTIFHGSPAPTVGQLVRRDARSAVYTLARDGRRRCRPARPSGIDRAHIVGVSMGGMIAQTIAARRPERVLSLTSIMSSTGSRWRGQPALRTYRKFLRPISTDRATYIAQTTELFAIIGSPGFERDPEELPSLLGAMYDRGPRPHVGQPPARRHRRVGQPHGRAAPHHRADARDPRHRRQARLPLRWPRHARAIPGARLVKIEGMGHDLPRGAWPQVIDAIVENTRRAGAPRATARPHSRLDAGSRGPLGSPRHLTEGGLP
jgi:pimeloyl-ACP methyl ester carboxylesterase